MTNHEDATTGKDLSSGERIDPASKLYGEKHQKAEAVSPLLPI
jgi:hypothetical protein